MPAPPGTRRQGRLPVRLLAGLLASVPLAATAQPVPPAQAAPPVRGPAPAVPKPDPAYEAARAAFEPLPEAERRAVQEALVWTGQFTSVASGAFGRRTYDAITAYQRGAGTAPSGVLADRERAALVTTGRRAREAAGFAVRTDAATGVALGVPAKLLPREQKGPQGTRWQSADGRITLETRAFAPGETDLQATFERVAATTPERKVTYKLKRPDFLVVTGETPTGRFYIRYADTPAGLRGFTLGYDKAFADVFDRVVIAVANSFEPQPGRASAAIPPATGMPSPSAGSPPAAPRAEPRTATALVVAPGRLLAAGLAACPTPRVGGSPARVVASEAASSLALLEASGGAAAPLALAPAPASGAPLVAVAMERAGSVVVPAEAAGDRVLAPLQPGAAGAPVLDRSGRLVGVVAQYPSAPTRVAGIVPPMTLPLVPSATIAAFLERNGVARAADAAAEPRSTGEIAARIAPALRVVACD